MVLVRDHRVIGRRYAYGISWIGQESEAQVSMFGYCSLVQRSTYSSRVSRRGVDVVLSHAERSYRKDRVISYHYSFMIILSYTTGPVVHMLTECGMRAVDKTHTVNFTLHTASLPTLAYRLTL